MNALFRGLEASTNALMYIIGIILGVAAIIGLGFVVYSTALVLYALIQFAQGADKVYLYWPF